MSATLVWANSGNAGPQSGSTGTDYINDLETLVNSNSGDPTFFWEVAGKESVTTPLYLLLRRKDASAGRIAIIDWSSAPALNNSAILDIAPTANYLYVAWFPSGNTSTLSNLDAASGTICGDDTNCVKVATFGAGGSVYQAPFEQFYFDCAEGMIFATGNTASASQMFMCAAGDLLVDYSDVAYGMVMGYGSGAGAQFGATNGPLPWSGTFVSAGSTQGSIRTNYGSANRNYFHAWGPSGAQFNSAVSSVDVLTQTSAPTRATAVACQLLGQEKLEGFVLKFRQFGYGPGSTSAFTVYNISGPVVNMIQICNATAGATGYPWATNFKL